MKLYKLLPVLAIAALTISTQLSTSCNGHDAMAPLVDLRQIVPRTAPANDSTAPALSRLDVLSYNVFLRPDPVSWGDANACRADAIADALVERATSLDVVALNETFETSAVERLVEGLGEHFPYRVLQKPKGKWLQVNGGISLLSKHPIRRVYSETFGTCSFADCMTAKGFLHAVIEVSSSKQVNILATHLDAGNSAWDVQSRRSQIGAIQSYMQNNGVGRTSPTILVGDLNVDGIRGAASRYAPNAEGRGEYGDMLARLSPHCASCSVGDCPARCNAAPSDAMTAGDGPWSFTDTATDGLNSLNCMDHTLDPCRSPNSRAHWKHRQRLDYVLTFPASDRTRRRLEIRQADYLPLRSDACGTRYLSDHKAIRAQLELPTLDVAANAE